MYPLILCEIMRDLVMPRCCFGYVSLGLVMFRLSLLFRLCFCLSLLFRYVIIHGYVLCIISMILYYIKDISYDLI